MVKKKGSEGSALMKGKYLKKKMNNTQLSMSITNKIEYCLLNI